jgi:hypothetical protein
MAEPALRKEMRVLLFGSTAANLLIHKSLCLCLALPVRQLGFASSQLGTKEGNRTLVFEPEGSCSTIELPRYVMQRGGPC